MRTRRIWADYQWTIIALLAVLAHALGVWGWALYLTAKEPAVWAQSGFLDLVYRSLTLFVLEGGGDVAGAPWQLEMARFLAPALLVYTAIMALFTAFRTQFQTFRAGFYRDHVVVCGLGEKGFLIATALRAAGRRVIIVELDASNGRIEEARDQGIVVLLGNATDGERLAGAGTARASHVFAVTGDDGVNAEVAVHARGFMDRRKSGQGLSCFVHISDPDLASFLEERSMAEGTEKGFRLEIFNIYESAARALVRDFPPWRHAPGGEGDDNDGSLRPAIVGLGRLGRAFVVEMAQQWDDASGRRLPILLVDERAGAVKQELENRFPVVAKRCDLETMDCDPASSRCIDGSILLDAAGHVAASVVYVCLGDDARALSVALGLRRHLEGHGTPLIVRTHIHSGLAALVESEHEPVDDGSLRVFSLYDRTCMPETLMRSTRERIAQAIHDGYLATQRRLYGDAHPASPAMQPWEQLEESYRESNRKQADHIIPKLHAIGCRIRHRHNWDLMQFRFTGTELDDLARAEHERWMDDRRALGWRYGADRNDRKKTHPDLVPWEALPEARRELDRDAVRKLPTYLAMSGFEIVRGPGR